MVHSKHNHQEKYLKIQLYGSLPNHRLISLLANYLEKCQKHVRFRRRSHNKRQKCGKSTVQNRRTYVTKRPDRSQIVSGPVRNLTGFIRDFRHEEAVGHVGRIVNAEANSDHQVDAADDIDGQAPKMHESADIDQSEQDATENLTRQRIRFSWRISGYPTGLSTYSQTRSDMNKEGSSDEKYHQQADSHVSPCFCGDDFICFPASIVVTNLSKIMMMVISLLWLLG